jgi:hypothetical protein
MEWIENIQCPMCKNGVLHISKIKCTECNVELEVPGPVGRTVFIPKESPDKKKEEGEDGLRAPAQDGEGHEDQC